MKIIISNDQELPGGDKNKDSLAAQIILQNI